MIPMENARKMLQGMPGVGGRPMPSMQGFGIRPQAPQAPQGMPSQPASINATPSMPSAVGAEVPGKQAPTMPALAAPQAPAAPPSGPATPSTTQAGGGLAPAPLPPPPPISYGNVSPITPGADLRDQTIAPGASADRVGMAKSAFDDYLTNKMPEYRANLRGLVQGNAAVGRSKSGMLRTDAGNLTDAFDRNATTAYSGFLRDATDKSITDQSNYRNELRGERGYENELEDQSFNRGRQEKLDQDYLQGTAFGRDATRTALGFQNDPTGLLAQIAASRGGQASQGAAAVGGLAQGTSYLDILKQIMEQSQGAKPTPGYGSGDMTGAF